jgi:anaerobic C4-dicarboxylate transporter
MADLLIDIKNMCKRARLINTRVLNNNPTRINILNKCDKKVLCVYIGTREIVYRCLPAVAKEALDSDKTVTINI